MQKNGPRSSKSAGGMRARIAKGLIVHSLSLKNQDIRRGFIPSGNSEDERGRERQPFTRARV
jgi:hypothetical protein